MTGSIAGSDRLLPEKLVSVIVPARNAAATIARTLRSLAPDAILINEVILVDDGSVDETLAVAKSVADNFRLPLHAVSASAGSAGAARNIGLEIAAGQYVYFVDSDDEPMPGCLHRLVGALAINPDCGLAIGANIRRTAGRVDKLKAPKGFVADRQRNAEEYLRNQILPIAMGSAMLRRDAIGMARFPEKAVLDEDTIFWAAILTQTNPIVVPHTVLIYHHDESRMKRRFLVNADSVEEQISHALDELALYGISNRSIEWRKSWIARRIARELILAGRFNEARTYLQSALTDQEFARSFKAWSYKARIAAGRLFEDGGAKPETPDLELENKTAPRNFLLVTTDTIFPPVSGSDHRNWALAKSLSRHGKVTVASVARIAEDIGVPDGIRPVSLSPQTSVRGKALRSWRAKIETRISVDSSNRLKEIASSLRPDVTIVSGIPLFGFLEVLKENGGRIVLDMQNVESALQRQHLDGLGALAKLRLWAQSRRTEWLERRAVGKVDTITVCSRLDRDRIVRHFRRRLPVHILPNIAPSASRAPSATPSTAPVIVFVGHLGYQPNVNAAVRLARKIMPYIASRIPSARLCIAGRFPRPEIMALEELPNVSVIANPPSVAELYVAGSIAVMPIASGGGTRIKILEAMAMGVPVVATRMAAEGLDLAEGLDFISGETDIELATAVFHLLEHPRLAMAMAERAKITVRAGYSAESLDEAIDSMI